MGSDTVRARGLKYTASIGNTICGELDVRALLTLIIVHQCLSNNISNRYLFWEGKFGRCGCLVRGWCGRGKKR
jgi:hypothetical protein